MHTCKNYLNKGIEMNKKLAIKSDFAGTMTEHLERDRDYDLFDTAPVPLKISPLVGVSAPVPIFASIASIAL